MEQNFTIEELVALVPMNLQNKLTRKQIVILGYFIMLNGLEESKATGTFYRSNEDICNDLDIDNKTLISACRKFEVLNLIERTSGYRKKGEKQASTYKLIDNNIFKTENNMETITNNSTDNQVVLEMLKVIGNYQEQVDKLIGIILNQNSTHNSTLEMSLNKGLLNETEDKDGIDNEGFSTLNSTTDTESDIEIEKEINNNINKIINNIKENSNNIKLNNNYKIEEKDNIINNIIEKENEKLDSTELNEVEDNNENKTEEENKIPSWYGSKTVEETLEEYDKELDSILGDTKKEENKSQETSDNEINTHQEEEVFPSTLERKLTADEETEKALDSIFGSMEIKVDNNMNIRTPHMVETRSLKVKSPSRPKSLTITEATQTLKPRMIELYSQCSNSDELKATYDKITKGLEDYSNKGKLDAYAFNHTKEDAWQLFTKYSSILWKANKAA